MGIVNLFGTCEHWHETKNTSVGEIVFQISKYRRKFPDENYRGVIVHILLFLITETFFFWKFWIYQNTAKTRFFHCKQTDQTKQISAIWYFTGNKLEKCAWSKIIFEVFMALLAQLPHISGKKS